MIKKLFIQSYLAWIWLALQLLQLSFFALNLENTEQLESFHKLVYSSSFLIYILNSESDITITAFAVQFMFWAFIGALILQLFKKKNSVGASDSSI